MKNKIRIIDFYFHVRADFYFEFLTLSLAYHFYKKWETKYSSFFIFMKEWKNKLLKQIMINFMIIFTSMVYILFKRKFLSSPLRFSAVQWSRGHQASAVYKTADVF